jgi:hypothetical protein
MEKIDKTPIEALDQFNLRIPHVLKMKFKKIAIREEREMTDILTDLLSDYVKIHDDGNPAFELDKWIEEPKFKSFPSFMRKSEEWAEYIDNFTTPTEQQEIIFQAQSILSFAQKKLKYGNTSVRTF